MYGKKIELMNESTVRAEILDPLLQRMGYKYGTDMHVMREHQFAYPKISLGRRSPKDPILRGRPDYICQVRGVATWVLEAKAEGGVLDDKENAQAYTYAAHPEIRAIYFCLSDGKTFRIYKTIAPEGSPPILVVDLSNLDAAIEELSRILGREALERLAAAGEVLDDTGNYEIVAGNATFEDISYEIAAPLFVKQQVEKQMREQVMKLRGLIYPIDRGTLEVHEQGLALNIVLGGQSQADLEFQKQIGIEEMYFETSEKALSNNSDIPTIFQSIQIARLKAGDVMETSRVPRQTIPIDMNMNIISDAFLHKIDKRIIGKFR